MARRSRPQAEVVGMACNSITCVGSIIVTLQVGVFNPGLTFPDMKTLTFTCVSQHSLLNKREPQLLFKL